MYDLWNSGALAREQFAIRHLQTAGTSLTDLMLLKKDALDYLVNAFMDSRGFKPETKQSSETRARTLTVSASGVATSTTPSTVRREFGCFRQSWLFFAGGSWPMWCLAERPTVWDPVRAHAWDPPFYQKRAVDAQNGRRPPIAH